MVKDKLIQKVHAFCDNHGLLPSKSTILIGLSGGPDSVFLITALAELAKEMPLTLAAAHLDHQWRADSYQDVQFCRELCRRLGIPFVSRTIQELGISFKDNGSREELGRRYRRHFFQAMQATYKADTIAVAHHADDQQETFFMRLLRGTSLTGLIGMRPYEKQYIRPLLSITKQEILDYLHKHKISYLTDPTNESDVFLRNRIRHQVIPALRTSDARFDHSFAHTLQRLQETEEFLDRLTTETLTTCSKKEQDKLYLHIPTLCSLHTILQYRVLMAWLCHEKVSFPVSQAFLDEILRFLKNKKNRHHISYNWHLGRQQIWAYIVNDDWTDNKNESMNQ